MKKILLLSDTHGCFDAVIEKYASRVDEIWHAGDIGKIEVADSLARLAPLRAVYGNIDDQRVRITYPKVNRFTVEGADVLMTHIGGRPGRYVPDILWELDAHPPGIFVCGHSHILNVGFDKKRGILCLNPGAAGVYGFHKVRTMLRFTINEGTARDLEVIEYPRTL